MLRPVVHSPFPGRLIALRHLFWLHWRRRERNQAGIRCCPCTVPKGGADNAGPAGKNHSRDARDHAWCAGFVQADARRGTFPLDLYLVGEGICTSISMIR